VQQQAFSSMVEVVATGLAGQVVWGPEVLPAGTSIRTFRTHLMTTRVLKMSVGSSGVGFCTVILDASGRAFKDEETIEGPGPRAYTVVFREFEPLTMPDRQRYKELGVQARRVPSALGQLPDAAQADEEVVLEHIGWHAESFRYTNEALRYDPTFQCKAVAANWRVLQYADDVVSNDVSTVARCVETDGQSLQFASEGLRDDKGLVLKAITSDSGAFKFASERLRADPEVVLAAMGQDRRGNRSGGYALQHAMLGARADKELVSAAVGMDPKALQYAEDVFRGDVDVTLCGIRSKNFKLSNCSEFLQMVDSSVLCNEAFLETLESRLDSSAIGMVQEILVERAKAASVKSTINDQEEMKHQEEMKRSHNALLCSQLAKTKWSEDSDDD